MKRKIKKYNAKQEEKLKEKEEKEKNDQKKKDFQPAICNRYYIKFFGRFYSISVFVEFSRSKRCKIGNIIRKCVYFKFRIYMGQTFYRFQKRFLQKFLDTVCDFCSDFRNNILLMVLLGKIRLIQKIRLK